ncbi:MAG: LutC/YkgG family protein [Acidimicrobiales bacterium]
METGDRVAFLDRLRARLADGVPENMVHPLPPPVTDVPVITPTNLDPEDLPGTFAAMATRVGMQVHRIAPFDELVPLLAAMVEDRQIRTAVVSADADARAAGEMLEVFGVEVKPLRVADAAEADLGVTGATIGIAATGSLVQASAPSGGRTASLLPTAHLCVIREEQLVATTRDAIRWVADEGESSNVVFVTGPSRSADIEQLLVTGVHGPTTVDVVLVAG